MLLKLNCHGCQGTGGLYDHALGIDDECVECEGAGFLHYASETSLKDYPNCETLSNRLVKKVNELRNEIDDNGGTANYILNWEEARCPCCESKLNFELGDDGLTTDVRCSEEGVCHFEIDLW